MHALKVVPLTMVRWKDFESLFGERGACGGCWCTYWRLSQLEYERKKGPGNRRTIQKLLKAGKSIGLLAYDDKTPVGWCSLAPREDFPKLNRSRVLAKVDDQPVWSVVCFFIDRKHRKRGLTLQLLKACTEYVKKRGGKIVEGYPIDSPEPKYPIAFAWTGFLSAFRKAGFIEAGRRSPTRPIMRYYL